MYRPGVRTQATLTPEVPLPQPDATTAEAALERLRPTLQAIPADEVRRCKVPGTAVITAARGTAKLLPADMDRMGQVFNAPPQSAADGLEDAAHALWAAELRLDTLRSTPKSDRRALYVEGGQLEARATSVLALLAFQDPSIQKLLDTIRPGHGYADQASDLGLIYPALNERKEMLISRELLTEAEINRIGEFALLLLDPVETSSDEYRAAVDLRNRAWTHFRSLWNELHRHLEFLYFDDPEGLDRYPTFWAGGRKRKASTGSADATAPAETETAEA